MKEAELKQKLKNIQEDLKVYIQKFWILRQQHPYKAT